jgi:hypothetical protein
LAANFHRSVDLPGQVEPLLIASALGGSVLIVFDEIWRAGQDETGHSYVIVFPPIL